MKKHIKIASKIIFATAIIITISFALFNLKKIFAYAYYPFYSTTIIIDEKYAATIVKEKLSLPGYVYAQILKGGNSGAKLFTVKAGTKKYVIRFLENKAETESRNEIEAATIASKKNYGPHIYFADEKQAIIIMDFLPKTKATFKKREDLYTELADLLRKIHNGPQCSKTLDIFGETKTKLKYIKSVNNNIIPLDYIEKTIKFIHQALAPHIIATACHNDLNPDNVIFLGQNKHNGFKTIDYERAAQGDPYFDVATIAISFCCTPGSEKILLKEYLQRQPSAVETAKLYLMKQLVWIRYSLYNLKRTQKIFPLYPSLKIPSNKVYIQNRFDKSILEDVKNHLLIAKIMITQVLENAKSQEFRNAIHLLKNSQNLCKEGPLYTDKKQTYAFGY